MFNEIIRTIANELVGAAKAKVTDALAKHGGDPEKFLINEGIAAIGRRNPLLADIANKVYQQYKGKEEPSVQQPVSSNVQPETRDTNTHTTANDTTNTQPETPSEVQKSNRVKGGKTNGSTIHDKSPESSRNTANNSSVVINTEKTVKHLEEIRDVLKERQTNDRTILGTQNPLAATPESSRNTASNNITNNSFASIISSVGKSIITEKLNSTKIGSILPHIIGGLTGAKTNILNKNSILNNIGNLNTRNPISRGTGTIIPEKMLQDGLQQKPQQEESGSLISTLLGGFGIAKGASTVAGGLGSAAAAVPGMVGGLAAALPTLGVAAAGAGGYALGNGISSMIDSSISGSTGGKSLSLGDWLYSKINTDETPQNDVVQLKTKSNIEPIKTDTVSAIQELNNSISKTDLQRSTANGAQQMPPIVMMNGGSSTQQSPETTTMLSVRNKESTFERVQMQDYWNRSI